MREALFDILGRRVVGAAILDAFAGTGAVGIEALSRGAARAVFLERDRRALALIRENLALGPWAPAALVLGGDVLTSLRRLKSQAACFQIAFLDPPYDQPVDLHVLETVAELVEAGGVVIAERRASDAAMETAAEALRRGRVYRYGDTALALFHRVPRPGEQA